ncbi:MAG: energy-coupling factor ABC transporter ATP-binding protein [Halorhodospira sp.]
MIDLQHVHYRYPGTRDGVLDITARIEAGERVALLGPNGCGKSTLLKLMNGLFLPDRGSIRFDGEEITAGRLRDRGWEAWLRQRSALLFQDPDAMLFNATVLDEIAYGPRQHGLPEPEARARAWAHNLGLGDQLARSPHRLSGGQKQRLALAAVLILEPWLLLLDEPAATLDPSGVHWLLGHLEARTGLALVVATHHWGVAERLADRVLILDKTQGLAYDGPLAQARAERGLLERLGLVF